MSGELTLENSTWRRMLLVLLPSVILSGALTYLTVFRLPLEGLGLAITAAVLVYVFFRLLYPFLARLFPQSGDGSVTWVVSRSALTLGDRVIPLDAIQMVHCWPNRDALGNTSCGWTVNIETTGKNLLLRSRGDGEEGKRSARQLRSLVIALGYGSRWTEE